jgi:uncharacterized membrane protein YhfC
MHAMYKHPVPTIQKHIIHSFVVVSVWLALLLSLTVF